MFMAVMGLVLFSTMALSSPYLQNVIGYPIITAGLLLASRGCGTFVAMMLVGRMMRYIEARTLIICGLSLTCLSLFYMTGWTDQTGVTEIVTISIVQGFGFGLVFVPLSHGGVPDAAQPSAHRRHLDADPDAQRRQLRSAFPSVIAQLTEGIAPHLRDAVAAHQPVQPRDADAGCARHDRHGTDKGRAMADVHGQPAGADHRLLAAITRW